MEASKEHSKRVGVTKSASLAERDALLVALQNLVTSVRTQHNIPEATGWAEEAIANSVRVAAIAKATGA